MFVVVKEGHFWRDFVSNVHSVLDLLKDYVLFTQLKGLIVYFGSSNLIYYNTKPDNLPCCDMFHLFIIP